MVKRRGLTIVELFVVLAIISVLLALLLPAVQSARERARETVCKNNVHQIHLAIARYAEAHNELPPSSSPGRVGGWMVEILPFIEQANLKESIVVGLPVADVPETLFQPPAIFRCPRRTVLDDISRHEMSPGNYVFAPDSGRETFSLFDAPVGLSVPWISGPEMRYDRIIQSKGPHFDGFFYASGFQQGVSFMLNGQRVR